MARAAAPSGFERIHRIIGKALRTIDNRRWPAFVHGGGPLPVLTTRDQLQVGLEVADAVNARSRSQVDDHVRACLEHARRAAELEMGSMPPELRTFLTHKQQAIAKTDTPPQRFAKLVVRAAKNYRMASPSAVSAVGTAVETAVTTHTLALPEAEQRGFLELVDGAIMRRELASALAERDLGPSAAIARVIARAPTPDDKLGCVLAELATGSFGLYAKLRARWEWHEGDLASMFATVPDVLHDGVGRGIAATGLR